MIFVSLTKKMVVHRVEWMKMVDASDHKFETKAFLFCCLFNYRQLLKENQYQCATHTNEVQDNCNKLLSKCKKSVGQL